MKKILFCLVAFILLMSVASFYGSGEEPVPLRLATQNGEYVLYDGENILGKAASLESIVPLFNGERVFFDNARIYEKIELSEGGYCFFGTAFFEGDACICVSDGAALTLDSFSGEFMGAEGISSYGGCLVVKDSNLICDGEYAINLSDSESEAYILGDSVIKGEKGGICSFGSLHLTKDGEKYLSSEVLKVFFKDKYSSEELFGKEKNYFPSVVCYDKYGEEIKLCRINYVNEQEYSYSVCRFSGESLATPITEAPLGYDFEGWRFCGAVIDNDYSIEGDMTLEASYSLKAPQFQITGVSFIYDGEERELSPSQIYHPLLPYGEVSYCWYKDGKMISPEKDIAVSEVSDSGKYSLAVVFGFGGEYSYTMVDNIEVEVGAKEIYLEYKDDKFVASSVSENEDLPEFYEINMDGIIYAKTENPNYCLKFTPQKIKNNNLSVGAVIALVSVVILIFISAFYVFKSWEIDKNIDAIALRERQSFGGDFLRDEQGDTVLQSRFFTLTPENADELLSSKLAKNMLKKTGCVYTSGKFVENVRLGDLSLRFASGERVDINKMKARGLVSENAYKVKVISDGSIDKPLTIMANDFDITAVKMIALLGGEAIKVKSKSK